MSGNSVDNRIVEMTFNNSEFERKMADTLKSLDALKKSLDFSASKKNVEDLTAATKGFNVGHMGQAVDNVSAKFLALSTIAVTALATITHKAIESGAAIVRALTIAPVLDGFREYETNINSIQTILANTKSKGTTLEDVTAALDLLNEYSDQTIYNFGQMTRNIGTFTAAGVDLDASVSAIKGIANLAAISGSNSEQASSAMYQLSQALATGTLKLIDWNSVVNAGMGGEVFQKALFETGKAMGTITDVDLGTTFAEWTANGNSFRASLESGWVTADVLTQTLQAFTGDLSEAQLVALGYTQQQAAELADLGRTGKAAATDVKTLTQLLSTVREAMGSGWSQSFRIIVGDFEQAKGLFTGLSNTIGGLVQANADARNKLLSDWAALGGRASLIQSMVNVFEALGSIVGPIKTAFRNIFPPITGEILFNLTESLRRFTESLVVGVGTGRKIRVIFEGLFSILAVGWEILKQGIDLVRDLFSSFAEAQGGNILDFFVRMANHAKDFREAFVDSGKISYFFTRLEAAIRHPIQFLEQLRDKIVEFFSGKGVDFGEVAAPFGRLQERFEGLKRLAGELADAWGWLKDAFSPVTEALGQVYEAIRTWFSELGDKLADGLDEGDFDALWDALNAALLGGILGTLVAFFQKGFKFDFGDGLLKNIGRSFDELTGTLKAMQTEIKADALLKIAGAIALLTGSVLVLSLIDSGALTKALTAMAVGFGQLIGAMQLLNSVDTGITGGATMTVIAGGMIAMATAVLILAGAVKILSTMDVADLTKGLAAVTILLGGLTTATRFLSTHAVDMLAGSAAMIAMAVALNILALAVLQFGNMEWEELVKGLVGVSGGLLIMAGAMNLMPKTGMIQAGIGVIAIAVALNILALALKSFAEMSWEEMGQGLVAVGGGLVIIAGAMHLMPPNLPITAAGLVLVGAALNLIALAMKSFADMSWGEMAQGLAGMAGSLLVLAGAVALMSNALPGAIAIGIIAGALTLLVGVVEEYAKIKWQELLYGLGGLAGTLAVLGLAAAIMQPIIPALLGLGAALILIGAGFALFGVGASLVAKAFEIIAKAGKKGVEVVIYFIDQLVTRVPEIATALAKGVINFATEVLEAGPALVKAFGILLGHILETIIEQTPVIVEAITGMILGLIQVIRDTVPEWIALGLELLTSFLTGIRDNIGDITVLVAEILIGFVDALTSQLPGIVSSVVDLFITFMLSVAEGLGRVAGTLLPGIGIAFIGGFITGLNDASPRLFTWFTELPGKIIGWIGDVLKTLYEKGRNLITGFFSGLLNKWQDVITWLKELPGKIIGAIPNPLGILFDIGKKLVQGLIDGIGSLGGALVDKVKGLAGSVIDGFTSGFGIFSPSRETLYMGKMLMVGLSEGLIKNQDQPIDATSHVANNVISALKDSLSGVALTINDMDEFQPTIRPIIDLTDVNAKAGQINSMFVNPSLNPTASLSDANLISTETSTPSEDISTELSKESVIKFEQNNYSPEPLTNSLLYRRTRSQIELAKRELAVA